jgi:hypothetical protein
MAKCFGKTIRLCKNHTISNKMKATKQKTTTRNHEDLVLRSDRYLQDTDWLQPAASFHSTIGWQT